MTRYIVDSWIETVAAHTVAEITRTISSNYINVTKIKVEPSDNSYPTELRIFAKNDFDPAYMVYKSEPFKQDLIDPVSDDGSSASEVNEGFIFPYEEEDGIEALYLKLYNDSPNQRTFTITITYEVSNAVTGREPVEGYVFTNFADQDWWIPFYPPGYISTTFNGAGSIKWESLGADSSAIMSAGIRARFIVRPNSDGLIKIRVKFENVDLFGGSYQPNRLMMIGTSYPVPNLNYGGPGIVATASSTTDGTIFFAPSSTSVTELIADRDTNYQISRASINDPCTIELILTLGTCTNGTGGTYANWGIVAPSCSYSINGETHIPFNNSSSKPWSDQYIYTQWMTPSNPMIGVSWPAGFCIQQQATLTEYEIMNGVILKS